jgi:putative hydrolase of the HAD superfamily
MILLFDAANTLIHKPLLYIRTKEVLENFGFNTSIEDLRAKHKIVSELIVFPDRTNKDFYKVFNKEWMYSLGILPEEELLTILFKACSYLPWEKFEDTTILKELNIDKAILSNFNDGLEDLIFTHFPDIFGKLVVSETEKMRKPDLKFFERAVEILGVKPEEIIYIGDSIKLDIEPALKIGMKPYLIDRNNDYPCSPMRIESLYQLTEII